MQGSVRTDGGSTTLTASRLSAGLPSASGGPAKDPAAAPPPSLERRPDEGDERPGEADRADGDRGPVFHVRLVPASGPDRSPLVVPAGLPRRAGAAGRQRGPVHE